MNPLDSLFELLRDGWHSINEISALDDFRKTPMPNLRIILESLGEFNFIEVSSKPAPDSTAFVMEAKLSVAMENFMRKIKWVECAVKVK